MIESQKKILAFFYNNSRELITVLLLSLTLIIISSCNVKINGVGGSASSTDGGSSSSESTPTVSVGGFIPSTFTKVSGTIADLSAEDGDQDNANKASGGRPFGLAYESGNLYISDMGDVIRKLDLITNEVTTVAGLYGTSGSTDGAGTAARFSNPAGMVSDGTYLYIADSDNYKIRRMHLITNVVDTLFTFPVIGGAGDSKSVPMGLTIFTDTNDTIGMGAGVQYILAATVRTCTVYIFDMTGTEITHTGIVPVDTDADNDIDDEECPSLDQNAGSEKYSHPWSVAQVSGEDKFYVLDHGKRTGTNTYPSKLRVFDIGGGAIISTSAGSTEGRAAGVGTNAKFIGLGYVAVIGSVFYVTDPMNHTIFKIIDPGNGAGGTVSIFAGTNILGFLDHATGTTARFNHPVGIATDGTNLYVADYGNSAIRKIVVVTGEVTTILGGL